MNIKDLVDSGIRLEKRHDQFFLKNELVLDEEVMLAGLHENDIVLEVGAGIGNLTRKLAEKCSVIAIESDRRFSQFLEEIPNMKVIYGDALAILKENRGKLRFSKIVSNIPYSISQKLILEFLKYKWEVAVLIVQKEFAQKMQGKGKLCMLLEDCADVGIVETIPKEDFYPEAVDSSLIVLKQKKMMDEKFWKFLKMIYRNRNKDAKNVITNCPGELARKKIHQITLGELKKIYRNI